MKLNPRREKAINMAAMTSDENQQCQYMLMLVIMLVPMLMRIRLKCICLKLPFNVIFYNRH